MDGCTIVFHDVPKVNDIVKELENNNPVDCYKLAALIRTEEFAEYCRNDEVAQTDDLNSINKNVLKRLIKNYRNAKVFSVNNTTKINVNSGMYQFRSQAAFDTAVQFTADLISGINYRASAAEKASPEYLKNLIGTAIKAFKKQLILKANQYGSFTVDNLEAAYYAIEENGTDQERNFKDMVQTAVSDGDYWNEVFYNSKIAALGRNTNLEDEAFKYSLMQVTDEDIIADVEQSDEVDLSTKQWDFGNNISNYAEHISEAVRQYFDSLQRLNSTQKFGDKKYDVNRNNPLGVPTCHTYQECVIELSNVVTNVGGFKSIEDFIAAIEVIANNKKEFSAFIKLADDMKTNDDLAKKIYTDLNKFIIDKLEIAIDGYGTIKSIQSNNSNNPVRKLYFNLRNDLKGSSIQNNNVDIEEQIDALDTAFKQYKRKDLDVKTISKFGRKNNTLAQDNVASFNDIVAELKDIYKSYFPSLNELAIDNYIERNNKDKANHRNENVDRLIAYIYKVNNSAKLSLAEKQNRDFQYRQVWGENERRLDAYREAVANGVQAKYVEKELPKFDTEYLVKADEPIGLIAKALEQYMYSKAELNSRNVEGNLNSDVIYNNLITNIAKICGDRETLSAWVKEKLKSTEYAYSNILIDRPEQGIIGLFRPKANGEYELTSYGHNIISPYLLNGVSNQQSGTNADYTKMSDGDYYLVGLYAYAKKLQTYKKYNTNQANEATVETSPFIMRIPSDAPKNFAVSMPKYKADDLWKYDATAMKDYIKSRRSELIKVADVSVADEQLTKLNSTNSTIEEVADLIVNTPSTIKTSPTKMLTIRPKVGTEQTVAYAINKPNEGFQYHYFRGTLTDDGKGNYTLTNVKYAGQAIFSEYIDEFNSYIDQYITNEFKTNHPEARVINKNNPLFNGFLNIVKGEIFDYYKALYDVEHSAKENLVEWFHYNPKVGVRDKQGNLTGNAFKFTKLDSTVGYNIGDVINSIVSEASSTGGIQLTGYSESANTNAAISFSGNVEAQLEEAVVNWLDAYRDYFVKETHNKFGSFLAGIDDYTIASYGFNAYLHFNNFDDLFEGNSKYYKDPQTFLKRAKESQAGGTSYSIINYKVTQTTDSPFTQSVNEIAGSELKSGDTVLTLPNGKPVTLRTGWNAVTIKNTIRPSSNPKLLYDKLVKSGVNKTKAKVISEGFGYVEDPDGENNATTSTVNDAQSYITIYEAARRLKILGEYPKYAKLIQQLTDSTTNVEQINPNELTSFIQVMKNFYFDHYYNDRFGRHLPRQIKNAEFVLVPKFLKGTTLGQLADFMIENDIDQINTQETSKAANYDVLTYWDNNGEVTPENLADFKSKATKVKQPFSYMYLYKQQDVPQHITNAQNKAGIQVMKKILDNSQDSVNVYKNNFIRAYVSNIREDFNSLMDKYGIKFDKNYNIIGNNGNVDYSRIYKLALIEASRLGLDSNTMDYLTIKSQNGATVMPNYMNLVASKIESIAQSQFNKFITRQKLPGWHAAQVTSIGLDGLIKKHKRLKKGETIETDDGKRVELAYHENDAEIEVLLPKWAKSMFNQYDQDGNLIREVNIEDVDEDVLRSIGYRIPTEGKQSMAVMKIVGFLPEWMGSTIVVPDEWVTQTGSDFDVDSVYGIAYETYIGKDGRVHKVEFSDDMSAEAVFGRYVSYVLRNSDRERISKEMIYADDDIKKSIKDKYFEVVRKSNKDVEDYLEAKVKKLIEEGDSYKELPNEFKGIIDPILQNKDIKFNERVNQILSIMPTYSKFYGNNAAFVSFYNKYQQIADVIAEQRDLFRRINDNANSLTVDDLKELSRDNFNNIITDRAKTFDLLTLDEFKELPIEDQNTRRARNNRIVDSMIAIMNDPSSLEENLARSNFEDISQANKDLNELDPEGGRQRNVYNLFDQIQFHRNAMGGATLKAFSVSRDTGNSVFNVAKAKLDVPIRIKYGDRIDLNIAKEAFPVRDGVVYHDAIGNSKNNKNVEGEYITVASSHTTAAHILDAIKEGAIKNENEYTFAAFKTLFDIGADAYTAMLWLRQPGVTRIVDAYYESQSVFVKGNYNPIHTAIKRVAHDLGIKINKEIVTDNNNITEVMAALQATYGAEFKAMYPNSVISFDNNANADVNMIDVEYMEKRLRSNDNNANDNTNLLMDLAAILNFDYINNYSKIISDHVKVINPDKFGAKQTIYGTRKVIENITSLINSEQADRIKVGGQILLEAIYPGITAATEEGIFMPSLYLRRDNKESAYPILDAFLRYSTVPSILINKGLFETESLSFVNAIQGIQNYISGNVTEKLYNDFKKYVLEYSYKHYSRVISSPVYLDKKGNIEIDSEAMKAATEEGRSPVEEETKRIYGFGYDINYNIDIVNITAPTQPEVLEFMKLTPAQKVHFVQRHLSGSERNIFNYVKVNLFNGYEFRSRGISSQVIRFDDQQQDMESIYKMFDAAFNNSNPIIRLTALDMIKYAFVVEGYQFRRGNISKLIKNNALYTSIEDGGTGIIDDIRFVIGKISNQTLIVNNIYEDYIRSHNNIPQIPTYRIRYNNGKPNLNYLPNSQNMYYFSLSSVKDKKIAKKIRIIKDVTTKTGKTKTRISANYINIVKGKSTTLYKVKTFNDNNNNIYAIYLVPLNTLEANEHGKFSSNPLNNRFPSNDYYDAIIQLSLDTNAPFSRLAKDNNDLFKKEVIDTYRYKKPTTEKEVIVPTDTDFVSTMASQDAALKNFVHKINEKFDNPYTTVFWAWNGNQLLKRAFATLNKDSHQVIADNNGTPKQYLIRRVKVNTKNKITNDAKLEGIELAKRNEVKTTDEIYLVQKVKDAEVLEIEKDVEDAEHASSVDIDAPVATMSMSNLGELAQQFILDIKTRARINSDENAMIAYEDFIKYGIDYSKAGTIEERKEDTIKRASEYYVTKAREIERRLNDFIKDDEGVSHSITSPYTIDIIKRNESLRNEYIHLILQASTFGNAFPLINQIATDNLDNSTRRNIKSIQDTINSIKNNTIAKTNGD